MRFGLVVCLYFVFHELTADFLLFLQPTANQYGSIDSGNAAIGQIPNERSVTPFLQDFVDPNMCYVPNGYPSYYYGGMLIYGC